MPVLMKYCLCIPQRFLVCAVCAGIVVISYMQRRVYNLVISEVVIKREPTLNTSYSDCPYLGVEEGRIADWVIETNSLQIWDTALVEALSRGTFTGYLVALIPAGMMADLYGAKCIVGWGFLLTSTISLSYPHFIYVNKYYVLMARFVQGVGEGMLLPGVVVMVAHWAPDLERTSFVGIVESGKFSGYLLAYTIYTLSKYFENTFEMTFYLSGTIGVLWCALFYLLIYGEPHNCPRISIDERIFIQRHSPGFSHNVPLNPIVPWKDIFKSKAFLSLVLFDFGSKWFSFTVSSAIFEYLVEVNHISSALSDSFTDLALSAAFVSSIFFAIFSDWLINHELMTRTVNRKVLGFVGYVLGVPLTIVIPFAGCNLTVVTVLHVCVTYLFGSATWSYYANCLDLSPRHAGVLFSITKTAGNISRMISFSMFSRFSIPLNWMSMCVTSTCILVISSLPYLWLGSAEIQPWNYPRPILRNPSRLRASAAM